ncbi:flagellar protein FliT [Massilia sp. 9096]|uniref:flagellar protein FliT n=1 Tax=Massilia sp. 9096 TaxID=1500894 RepID=UPI000AEE5CFE|nr:flagellar protein FliT [Massilia sp. 9096]
MMGAQAMSSQDVISVYEAMVGITDQMLAAANASDWERLVQLEHQCAACVRQLKACDALNRPLAAPERAKKANAIRRMLDSDRKIRDLTQPWMARLSAMISNKTVERRIARAYGV